jgi:Mce-associated membrane protein
VSTLDSDSETAVTSTPVTNSTEPAEASGKAGPVDPSKSADSTVPATEAKATGAATAATAASGSARAGDSAGAEVDKAADSAKPAEADATAADKPAAQADTTAAEADTTAADKPAAEADTTAADKPAAEVAADKPATEVAADKPAAVLAADKPASATAEPTVSAEADEPAQARVPAQPSPAANRRVLVPIALAAVALASLVAVAVLGWQAISASRAQSAQNAALDAARSGTTQVLSYDSKTLDADLARSRTLISGPFAAKFEDLANSVIVPAVRQQSLSTKANVVRAAVIEAQPEQVQALLFVNQTTTVGSQPGPHSATNQVRVTMTWSDGHWLISDVQPL